jgi:hypothetical protein
MTGSMSGWSVPEDFSTFVGDNERKLAELGRRTRVPRASQILGPGIAPWAVRLFDWNDPKTAYNGIFYSEVGAINGPDDTKAWIGTSHVTQDGYGIQVVREFGASVTGEVELVRRFWVLPGATTSYGPWEGDLPSGFTATVTGPWATTVPGPTDGPAFTCREGILRMQTACSAFANANVGLTVEVYIDGVLQGNMRLAQSHSLTVHLALVPLMFSVAVDAGTHHYWFRQTSGISDGSDRGSLIGTVTPT